MYYAKIHFLVFIGHFWSTRSYILVYSYNIYTVLFYTFFIT